MYIDIFYIKKSNTKIEYNLCFSSFDCNQKQP